MAETVDAAAAIAPSTGSHSSRSIEAGMAVIAIGLNLIAQRGYSLIAAMLTLILRTSGALSRQSNSQSG